MFLLNKDIVYNKLCYTPCVYYIICYIINTSLYYKYTHLCYLNNYVSLSDNKLICTILEKLIHYSFLESLRPLHYKNVVKQSRTLINSALWAKNL